MVGCRDCSRCTESSMKGCLMMFPRLLTAFIVFPWLLMQRKCPHCKHPLVWHEKRADGSFKD